MEKIIVDNNSIRSIINHRYGQNNKVIDVSDLDTSKCTNISCLFSGLVNLEEIKGFNMLNLCNVTNMSRMCDGCHSLERLNLSGLDLHNVKDMSRMCDGCHSLKELDLSSVDLHNVTDMFDLCEGCCSLIDFKVDEQHHQKKSTYQVLVYIMLIVYIVYAIIANR